MKYKTVEANFDQFCDVYKFKKSHPLEDLIEYIGDGFLKGVKSFRLFENYNHKNTFLEIKSTDYNTTFNERLL